MWHNLGQERAFYSPKCLEVEFSEARIQYAA
jgi:hypothetical protein